MIESCILLRLSAPSNDFCCRVFAANLAAIPICAVSDETGELASVQISSPIPFFLALVLTLPATGAAASGDAEVGGIGAFSTLMFALAIAGLLGQAFAIRYLTLLCGALLLAVPGLTFLPETVTGVFAQVRLAALDCNVILRTCMGITGVSLLADTLTMHPRWRFTAVWLAITANLVVGCMLLVRWVMDYSPSISWQIPGEQVLGIGLGLTLLGVALAVLAHLRDHHNNELRLPGYYAVASVLVVVPVGFIVLSLHQQHSEQQWQVQQRHTEFTAAITRHNILGLSNILRANSRDRFLASDPAAIEAELNEYLTEVTIISRVGLLRDGRLTVGEVRGFGCELDIATLRETIFSRQNGMLFAVSSSDFFFRLELPGARRELIACVDLERARDLWLPSELVGRYNTRFYKAIDDSTGVDLNAGYIDTHQLVGVADLSIHMTAALEPFELWSPQRIAMTAVAVALLLAANWLVFVYVGKAGEVAISERRREQLETVMNHIDQGVMIAAPDGRILLTNPALRTMLARDDAQLLGTPLGRYLRSAADLNNVTDLQELFSRSGQKALQLDARLLVSDEDERRVEVSMMQVPLQNRTNALLLLITDYSGIDAMELKLREHNQRLVDVNRELEEFSYMASHDLREPLRTITSFTKLLRRNLGGDVGDQVKEDLHYIDEAVARTNQIIAGLLQLSRAGRRELDVRPVTPAAFIEPALDSLAEKIAQLGAEIAVDSDDRPIAVDAALFEQLVALLVDNALKFQPQGNIPTVEISSRYEGEQWCLRVRDNGIGIAPEFHAIVFGSFKRLHGISEYPGTGSGLAVVKKIAERHNATVHIDSAAGEGATFIVTLATDSA